MPQIVRVGRLLGPRLISGGFLLDTLSQSASLAFSFRRLTNTFMGSTLVRARRGSDNAEADFGFVGAYLDVAGLIAFCAGGDGFLVRWYDQMTAAGTRYWVNATAASQPRIVSSGVLDADAGRAGAVALTAGARMAITGGAAYQALAPSAISLVCKSAGTNSNLGYVTHATDNGTSNGARNIRNGRAQLGTSASGIITPSAGTKVLRHAAFPAAGSTSPSQWVNGTLATTNPTAGVSADPLGAGFNLFSGGISAETNGMVMEVVVFDLGLTNDNRLAIQADVGAFYGISMS